MVREGLLRGPRRAQERRRRGHQEGVPQARAAAPPGRERREHARPRSASRRSPPPTTSSATRRSAPPTTASARWARPGSAAGSRAVAGAASAVRASGGYGAQTIDLEDLLGGMFGGCGATRRAARRAHRGADLETRVRLSFDDAMAGVTLPVTLTGPAPCSVCKGSGAAPGTEPVTCPDCGGVGPARGEPGLLPAQPDVPALRGSGRLDRDPVPDLPRHRRRAAYAHGPGEDPGRACATARGSRSPARASPGTAGRRRRRPVRPGAVGGHAVFGRKGHDLTLALPVTYPEAALGAKVQVPDARRPGDPEGAGRHAEREDLPRQGQGRAPQGRTRRPARDRRRRRAEEAVEGAEASC